MTHKIEITDPIQARACIQWLIREIGPVVYSAGGPAITGEGWTAYTSIRPDRSVFLVEVNDHVDDATQLLFALKWA
jgi:hypothetical protein